jgi:dTDP-4-amino-4,6-dideoxygalactose transaminase
MTDIQAVIGLGQLRRLDEMLQNRRVIQFAYNEAFKKYDWFKFPIFTETVQYYTPEWKDRDGLCSFLAEKGIATSVHFQPLSETTYWKKAVKNPLPVTDRVWKKLLSLPVFNSMTREELKYIIDSVIEFHEKK